MKYCLLCFCILSSLCVYVSLLGLIVFVIIPIKVDPPFILPSPAVAAVAAASATQGLLNQNNSPNFTALDKIDLVYTFVNSSDPFWKKKFSRYERDFDNHEVIENKYRAWDELRYSLRSIEMYMKWVNHIYIVVAFIPSQIPLWLKFLPQDYRIRIITHAQIGLKNITFNSNVIESRIHHIPGLSENFLSMNNDLFLGSQVTIEDFVYKHEQYIEYSDWNIIHSKRCEQWYSTLDENSNVKQSTNDKMFRYCLRNNYFLYETILIRKYFNPSFVPTYWFCHMPHLYNRHVLMALEEKLLPFFTFEREHNIFRDKKTDMNVYILYMAFLKSYYTSQLQIKPLVLSRLPKFIHKQLYLYTLIPNTKQKYQDLEKHIDVYAPKFIGIEDDIKTASHINITQQYFAPMMNRLWYVQSRYELPPR